MKSATHVLSAGCALGALLHVSSPATHGQVTFDGTVGRPGSLSGPNITVGADRGRRVGSNLFHSFSRLDVPTGGAVRFAGPRDVGNVLARVTGPNPSQIDGTLGCDIRGANLFLINPNGIIFGPGGRLDVSGSFVASTADELELPDGGRFSAAAPDTDVLTTGHPTSFGFLRGSPGEIRVDEATLNLPARCAHALVGGEVRIARGKLLAPAGSIRIVSVGGNTTVAAGDGGTSPSPQAGAARGDVRLENDARIDVGATAGPGEVHITAGNLSIDRSRVAARNRNGPLTAGINFELAGDLRVTSGRIETGTSGPGPGAPVRIAARNVSMVGDKSKLLTGVDTSSGSRGNPSNAQVAGPAGDVNLIARGLRLVDGARIDTSTYSRGSGGNITANVRGTVYIADEHGSEKPPPYNNVDNPGETRDTGLIARTVGAFDGAGRSGNIDLTARNLSIGASGIVSTSTRALGDAGSVRVNLAERIEIRMPASVGGLTTSGGILSQALPEAGTASGDGGGVWVSAASILIDGPVGGAVIGTTTRGDGSGGNVLVEADEVTLTGAEAFISARSRPIRRDLSTTGGAGTVEVRARSILVTNDAQVSVDTTSGGPAGNLSLWVQDQLVVRDSGAVTASSRMNSGGNVTIVSDTLTVDNGSIAAAAQGDGGKLLMIASQVTLRVALLSASAQAGNGGDLTLLQLPERHDSLLSARGGTITATADVGRGGHIAIHASRQDLQGTVIVATGGQGDPGTVDVSTTTPDFTGALVPLDAALPAPQAQLYDACASLVSRDLSTFVVTGGGVPLDPLGWTPLRFDVPSRAPYQP